MSGGPRESQNPAMRSPSPSVSSKFVCEWDRRFSKQTTVCKSKQKRSRRITHGHAPTWTFAVNQKPWPKGNKWQGLFFFFYRHSVQTRRPHAHSKTTVDAQRKRNFLDWVPPRENKTEEQVSLLSVLTALFFTRVRVGEPACTSFASADDLLTHPVRKARENRMAGEGEARREKQKEGKEEKPAGKGTRTADAEKVKRRRRPIKTAGTSKNAGPTTAVCLVVAYLFPSRRLE